MPNGVQEIYSKTGIISKYLLHKTYRCAKLYSKIWALTEKTLPLHPRLSYGVMVALQFLVLSVVVRIRLGQQQGIRRSNKGPRIFRLELHPEIQHL